MVQKFIIKWMKNLLFLPLLFMSFGLEAQEIKWMTLNEALDAQKTEYKKIFMDVYTDWCGPCKLLDKKTFHNKDVVEYVNTHFYAVKFNAESDDVIIYNGKTYKNDDFIKGKKGKNRTHSFATELGVRGYPCIVFLDEKSSLIPPVIGYKKPTELEIYLKLVYKEDYKNIKTAEQWEEYQKSFKSTFKD